MWYHLYICRSRTLDNAFIILDEVTKYNNWRDENVLTRIGFGSKVIVTGDKTQKDLPAGVRSGLHRNAGIEKVDEISILPVDLLKT